ncbi:MAG TPA: tRNA dihydrouridine(20/20a) synthase DusA [Caulobacteraceae bacterium]|nr:tRNA dihydrouridine(20/20a) synthase DusA [Caulobacteraceae bacterium]
MTHRLCIAPMMDWTDRHCRFFHRLLTRRARLYTEMLTTGAVIHGDRGRLLAHDPAEHPVALQLGGCEPQALAEAARIGEDFGYDEVNLNVGCPSDRVQSGRFGACLMREPQLVGECLGAMVAAVAIPVTLKCRIGVDEQDPEAALFTLADAAAAAGVAVIAVHARKAWLEGLSPKENRDIPPLDYGIVRRLKRERPQLTVVINGGIGSLEAAREQLAHVDGVMLGRAAYREPAMLGGADAALFGDGLAADPARAARDYLAYVRREAAGGTPLFAMSRHMLGLFAGRPGARAWRRILTVESVRSGAGAEVIEQALEAVSAAARPLVLA